MYQQQKDTQNKNDPIIISQERMIRQIGYNDRDNQNMSNNMSMSKVTDKNYDPRAKVQLVNLLFQFFQNSTFKKTQEKLKEEAMLNFSNKENINSFITIIESSSQISQNQKVQKIKNKLEKEFVSCIKKNKLNEALQIMNTLMPKYFEETQKFSDYFFNPPKQQPPLLNEMISSYFDTEKDIQQLPTKKVKTIKTMKQIWFIKYGGQYTIAIDLDSKGYMIKDGEILLQRQEMHSDITTCVRWKNQKEFGTCSADKTIKLWNCAFDLLRTIDCNAQVNSLCFSQKFIIAGGHNQCIAMYQHKNVQTKQVNIIIKKKEVTEIQYYERKNQILGAFCEYKKRKWQKIFSKSQFMIINVQTTNIDHERSFTEEIYGICLSEKQGTFYINFKSGEIHSYSFETYEKIRSFYGMLQIKFLIRMECGGSKQRYLATGSEDGDVIIFFQGKSDPICRLYCQKTVVNCAAWIGPNLICGCDNGQIMLWQIPKGQQDSPSDKISTKKLMTTTDSSYNTNELV